MGGEPGCIPLFVFLRTQQLEFGVCIGTYVVHVHHTQHHMGLAFGGSSLSVTVAADPFAISLPSNKESFAHTASIG